MAVATAAKLAGAENVTSMMPAVAASEIIGARRRNNSAVPEPITASKGRTNPAPPVPPT
jgi:hypothetical protein